MSTGISKHLLSTQVTRHCTVGSHFSEHAGTERCLDNWNVRISETILLVYKAEHFPLFVTLSIWG